MKGQFPGLLVLAIWSPLPTPRTGLRGNVQLGRQSCTEPCKQSTRRGHSWGGGRSYSWSVAPCAPEPQREPRIHWAPIILHPRARCRVGSCRTGTGWGRRASKGSGLFHGKFKSQNKRGKGESLLEERGAKRAFSIWKGWGSRKLEELENRVCWWQRLRDLYATVKGDNDFSSHHGVAEKAQIWERGRLWPWS